jgi:hypothetical protein
LGPGGGAQEQETEECSLLGSILGSLSGLLLRSFLESLLGYL